MMIRSILPCVCLSFIMIYLLATYCTVRYANVELEPAPARYAAALQLAVQDRACFQRATKLHPHQLRDSQRHRACRQVSKGMTNDQQDMALQIVLGVDHFPHNKRSLPITAQLFTGGCSSTVLGLCTRYRAFSAHILVRSDRI